MMAWLGSATKNCLHNLHSFHTLLIASFVLAILSGGTANAATCGPTVTGNILERADASIGPKNPELLGEQVRAAIQGPQPDEAQRKCEITALIDAATAPALSRFCTSNTQIPIGATTALSVLGALNTPWEGVDVNDTDAKADILYSTLACISDKHRAVSQNRNLRRLLTALESALANRKGGFLETLQSTGDECAQFENKVAHSRGLRLQAKTEFAIKSVVVEITALVTSAKKLQGRPACRSYEDAVRLSITVIDKALSSNLAGNSIEGWRWINDLLYAKSTYHLALGELDKAQQIARTLNSMTFLSDLKGPYALGVHPATVTILKEHDKSLRQEGFPSYSDQVYISQPLPGYAGPEGTTVSTHRRNYFPIGDIVRAIGDVANRVKSSPPQNYPCKSHCGEVMEWVNTELANALTRRDLRIVAGSFLNEETANRGVSNVCSSIGVKGQDCPFKVDRHRQYFRVATKEVSDTEAGKLQSVLDSRGVESFVSRPRILPSLSKLKY